MKAKHHLLFSLLFFLGTSVFAQYWISPVNGVPFPKIENTTDSTVTLIKFLNHVQTYDIDSFGNIVWRTIPESEFNQIFGYDAFDFNTSPFADYSILFDTTLTISYWSQSDWDSIIPVSPWILNRNEILTPGMMGALIAFDWYEMDQSSAKMILNPTVPIIEGEDMDFTSLTGDLAFDIDDYLTPAVENQKVIDFGIYVFNKPDFKLEYDNGFIPWMMTTKPFLPDSFTFNTYHDWLYEYFHPIAVNKVAQILTTNQQEKPTTLIFIENAQFLLKNEEHTMKIRVSTTSGQELFNRKIKNQTTIDLSQYPKGIYILDIEYSDKTHQSYKLFK